jgi:hypothetical protein
MRRLPVVITSQGKRLMKLRRTAGFPIGEESAHIVSWSSYRENATGAL